MSDQIRIAPSILSADFTRLGEDLASIATADFVHYDVMDGHFVPNISFGIEICHQVKQATELPVDVHLMVTNPDDMVEKFLDAGADYVSFHWEATAHANRLVQLIHERGAKASVAICPATPVSVLDAIIDDLDMVLVMTVNPGFGGQKYIPSSARKLRQLRRMCDEHGVSPLVEVDGGISAATAGEVCGAGADVLVAGSAVFKAADRAEAIAQIREAGVSGTLLKA